MEVVRLVWLSKTRSWWSWFFPCCLKRCGRKSTTWIWKWINLFSSGSSWHISTMLPKIWFQNKNKRHSLYNYTMKIIIINPFIPRLDILIIYYPSLEADIFKTGLCEIQFLRVCNWLTRCWPNVPSAQLPAACTLSAVSSTTLDTLNMSEWELS